jgi:mitochondrial-processing peptidase subunit alpha
LGNCEEFNTAVFRTAFGLKGLGLPLRGLKGNVGNLSSYVLQKFQLENITPNRIFVCGSGIESHQEFLDLVSEKLSYIPAVDNLKTSQRAKSEYTGGEIRNNSEDHATSLGLYFEGVNWASNDVATLLVANALLNNLRLKRNVTNKLHYVDYARGTNVNFTDSGLFGLRLSGSAENTKDILNAITSELKGLTQSIKPEELNRAKATLRTNVLINLERQADRLEDTVKYYRTFRKTNVYEYLAAIDKVTGEQINKAVA